VQLFSSRHVSSNLKCVSSFKQYLCDIPSVSTIIFRISIILNAQDGNTALMFAASENRLEILRLLLEFGANSSVVDNVRIFCAFEFVVIAFEFVVIAFEAVLQGFRSVFPVILIFIFICIHLPQKCPFSGVSADLF
jgi:hypothetical protein